MLRVIQQQEHELAQLHAKTLEKTKELLDLPSKKSRKIFVSYSFSNKTNVEEVLRDIFDRYPDDSGISIVKNEYSQIEEDVWEKSSNLSGMVGLLGLLLRLQNEKIVSLNMDIDNCHIESSVSYVNFYKSIKQIIAPVTGTAEKDYLKVIKHALDHKDEIRLLRLEKKAKKYSKPEDKDKR